MVNQKFTPIDSKKSIPASLTDIRQLFRRYLVEDWEPVPGETDRSYSIRYLQAGAWETISSRLQPTKEQNLRQCYQVIQYILLWGSRGVSGVRQGVTFIHGGIELANPDRPGDSLAEAYATLGVEQIASMEEIHATYLTKIKFSHPDGVQDPEEKLIRGERTQRLNVAMETIEKNRGKGS